MLRKVCRLVALLVFLVHPGLADFLTGSNDIIAVVREETGELTASPGEGVNEDLASLVILVTSDLAAEVDTEVREPT